MLNELSKEIHQNAVNKGFYDKPVPVGTALMLIVSELGEALEADRKMHRSDFKTFNIRSSADDESFKQLFGVCIKDTYEDELADALIRILDHAAHKGIDLDKHVAMKMRYNSLREHKHGKSY